jgi:hypothetical protein
VRETLALGEPTLGASVSGAGTPTPFRRILPTFGTNRLGFGAETPTPGADARRLEVRQSAFGEVALTLELCAAATVNRAGRKAIDKIANPGANKALEALSFIRNFLNFILVSSNYFLKKLRNDARPYRLDPLLRI